MNIHQTMKKLALRWIMVCAKQLVPAAYAKNNFSKQLVVNLFAINRVNDALVICNLFLLILSLLIAPSNEHKTKII